MENQKSQPQPQPVPVQPETISIPKEEYCVFSAWREKQKLPLEQFVELLADTIEHAKHLESEHNEQNSNFNEIVAKIGLFYPAELENVLITNGINPFAQVPKKTSSENCVELTDSGAEFLRSVLLRK